MGVVCIFLLIPTLWLVRNVARRDAFYALMAEEASVKKAHYARLQEIDRDMEIAMEQESLGLSQLGSCFNSLKRLRYYQERIACSERYISYLADVERRMQHPLFGLVVF